VEAKNTDSPAQMNSFNRAVSLMKLVGNVFFGVMLMMVVLMVFFVIQNKISGGQPKFAGHYMYIVLSGSMAPEFDTGSVAFVRPVGPEQVKEGDIITFKGLGDSEALTTHRVVEIDRSEPGKTRFITKGDANDVNDPNPVPGKNLVGKVTLAIPYLGYLMSFGQTKQGLLVLIIIPGALLIIFEAYKLYIIIGKSSKEKKNPYLLKQAMRKDER